MTLLWLAPALVALMGLFVVMSGASRVNDELRALRGEARRYGELQPALVELRQATAEIRDTARTLGPR